MGRHHQQPLRRNRTTYQRNDEQTVADVDLTGDDSSRVGGEEDTASTNIPIETTDGNNENGEYRSWSTAEKENILSVVPDLKEFDFTATANNDSDEDDDDGSPVQQRLFVNKKRVLGESDDKEILARGQSLCRLKCQSRKRNLRRRRIGIWRRQKWISLSPKLVREERRSIAPTSQECRRRIGRL